MLSLADNGEHDEHDFTMDDDDDDDDGEIDFVSGYVIMGR